MIQSPISNKSINFINKNDFIEGAKASIPICLGYIPLGIACGILSEKAGLSPFQIGYIFFICLRRKWTIYNCFFINSWSIYV